MNEPILSVTDLAFAYPGHAAAFQRVSFSLAAGEIMTILGPNGVGKSTLLRCLSQALVPTQGKVILAQRPLAAYSSRMLARQIAVVPQNYHLETDLRVAEYVLTGRIAYHPLWGQPNQADRQLVNNILTQLQLQDLSQRRVTTLSGGQKQLVTIARALAQQPQVLLLDEPMAALDLGRQAQLLQQLKSLQNQGMAILLTSHLPNHAFMLGGKVGLLSPTAPWQAGPVNETATEANLSALYQTPLTVVVSTVFQRPVCDLKLPSLTIPN